MFEFIRKNLVWELLDEEWDRLLERKISYQLKSAQDLAILSLFKDARNLQIAEIGGGDSRILKYLTRSNTCYNIDRFQGDNQGPTQEIQMEGVKNIIAFLGTPDLENQLPEEQFDIVFSISVVEHVKNSSIQRFHEDQLRILKKGGVFAHAIDMYISDILDQKCLLRFNEYRKWIFEDNRVDPVTSQRDTSPVFRCDYASNPDNILYSWGKLAPDSIERRKVCQNVSLLIAGRKI